MTRASVHIPSPAFQLNRDAFFPAGMHEINLNGLTISHSHAAHQILYPPTEKQQQICSRIVWKLFTRATNGERGTRFSTTSIARKAKLGKGNQGSRTIG